jgi:bis(5'-nucleosyl)-tetraphosphatase (symmetrical)
MTKYFIGDVHGCYAELMKLLDVISYDSKKDSLYFAGDLVNKGPKSYETIKFIMDQPNADTVLGNHDLHLMALASGLLPKNKSHNLDDILKSRKCHDIIDWLRTRPLLIRENSNILVHAGIHPTWDIDMSIAYANEVETHLQSNNWQELIANMYGNTPNVWSENLTGWDRIRCLINIFTRMRFISTNYTLDFDETAATTINTNLKPWFQYPNMLNPKETVYFGHWASLKGNSGSKQFISIDGGCVWGNKLIAISFEDNKMVYYQNVLL